MSGKNENRNLIAVYGSLRFGEYNYHAFNERYGLEYLKTVTVNGYELYSLGSYPCAVQGEGKLTIDLFEVGEECFTRINWMEIGAGYTPETINVNGDLYTIWLMDKATDIDGEERVESGDWSSFINSTDGETEGEVGDYQTDIRS